MKFIITSVIVLLQLNSFAQSSEKLIADIQKAQSKIKSISYTLQRTDTFVAGQVRTISGKAILQPNLSDSIFGFLFWAKRDDLNRETIYDGRIGFEVYNEKKSYDMYTTGSDIPHVLGYPGGQIVFNNLVKLDTSKAIKIEASEDKDFFYLTLYYADIKEYDVTNRYTKLSVDKKLMLPVKMKQHQETLGKVQDLNYLAKDISINNTSDNYDFSGKTFLNSYSQRINEPSKALMNLKDKEAPLFELTSFNNKLVSSAQFTGKVVLLDFWEVWCGPCLASMPKVQTLFEKYKDKGFLVYGISCEKDQLESAKRLMQKRPINFPMLSGNELVKRMYKVNAVPLYILINKKGKISFLSEGYSEDIEKAIQNALSE